MLAERQLANILVSFCTNNVKVELTFKPDSVVRNVNISLRCAVKSLKKDTEHLKKEKKKSSVITFYQSTGESLRRNLKIDFLFEFTD